MPDPATGPETADDPAHPHDMHVERDRLADGRPLLLYTWDAVPVEDAR